LQKQIQFFENKEFGKFEVLTIDGKPYFPATESAKILGYSNTKDAILRHCKGVVKHDLPTNGGIQVKNFITEGDLYRLIIRSKLPAAARFEKYVFDEVLPSIRSHGAYITEETMRKMNESGEFTEALLKQLADERTKNNALHEYVEKIAPKARYYDAVLQSPYGIQASVIAKEYGMSAVKFNKLLHALGVQYKIGKTWLLYADYANNGYTVSKTICIGGESVSILTCFTQRGRKWLYDVLKSYGLLPLNERPTKK
jgi:prophage antirepressor-like protein